MIKYISRILMLLLLGCAFSMQAADVAETRGTVTDSYGNPVAGAVVYAENGRSIGTTDVDGVFTAPVTYIDSKVKIEFLGYQTVETTLTSGMTTVLPFDNHKKNQKLNLGNISFERQDFGGAIDIATGKKLDRQPVSSMASLFPGNFTGLLSTEGSTETTLETFNYFVRGISDPHADSPLIVIDGNICYPGTESETLRYITPSEIDQITILKDAASQAIYGGQGANGVMVITTKRGTAGAPRVNAYIDASINQLSVVPDFVDSYHYATLRNQAGVNDGHGKNYYFTDDQIEGYRTQSDTRLYPNNNWRSQFLRKFVLMQRAAFDVSGGNDWVNYYVNVNTLHDGGAFHVEDNKARLGDNSYNPNTNFIWANFRSNVQAKITSWLSARVNLSGNIKREHMSQGGRVESLYSSMFVVPPTVYGPTTPYNYNEDGTLDESEYPGGQCIVTQKYQSSVYGNLNRTGEKHYTQTNINSSVSLDFDFNSITKGLTASAVIGYHSYMQRVLGTSMGYRHYMLDDNALKTGKWTFTRQGTSENDPLSWSASSQSYLDMNYRAYINYERSFGLHNVKAQAFSYLEHYENTDLPYQFINNGVDLSYNYAHRYSIRGVFSYSGSDLFSRDSRWQSLPAISLAWNANNEEFLKDYTWLSNAKLRFTVGKTGNTRSTGIGRYTYDDQMNYSTGGGALYTGDLITETYVGNPNLHAETMKKWDAGIDLGFFNMIDLTFDIYHEKMNDWIISNTVSIPEYQGAPLGIYPVTNIGKYKNKGFEIGLNIAKQYKDWEFSVGGYALRHKDLVIYCAEASRGDGLRLSVS
jgi:TonB-linked SusC/RagA family outer membrane protein